MLRRLGLGRNLLRFPRPRTGISYGGRPAAPHLIGGATVHSCIRISPTRAREAWAMKFSSWHETSFPFAASKDGLFGEARARERADRYRNRPQGQQSSSRG